MLRHRNRTPPESAVEPSSDRPGSASYWRSPTTQRIGYAASHLDPRVPPGLSDCMRCRTSWAFVDGHTTEYGDGSGSSILCEECWAELTPQERLPFYRVHWEQGVSEWRFGPLAGPEYAEQGDRYRAEWPKIQAAVLAGG